MKQIKRLGNLRAPKEWLKFKRKPLNFFFAAYPYFKSNFVSPIERPDRKYWK